MQTCKIFLVILTFLALLTGCSHYHYPVNAALKEYKPDYGYKPKNVTRSLGESDLFLLVTFSGGGTRAASFSYGVLEALRDTKVSFGGREFRLLDEIDVISGVSGGSFTAAWASPSSTSPTTRTRHSGYPTASSC